MKTILSMLVAVLAFAVFPAFAADVAQPGSDRTSFQEGGGYSPKLDIGSDMAMVYGVGTDFATRAQSWRDKGYTVGMMTGIAWGGYQAYFVGPNGFKKDEVQTEKGGKLILHGENIGYNVPTDGYIEFLKKYMEPAVDAGAQAIFFEEPEFWTRAGWSEAFKQAWQAYYGEPWQEPDSTPEAQYRASRLKYGVEAREGARRGAGQTNRMPRADPLAHQLFAMGHRQPRVAPDGHQGDGRLHRAGVDRHGAHAQLLPGKTGRAHL
jgi:hypothetical protein